MGCVGCVECVRWVGCVGCEVCERLAEVYHVVLGGEPLIDCQLCWSVERKSTDLLPPHKLPRTFSPVCFAPFSEFHHTTPLWLHLPPPSLDCELRQTIPSRADDFTDHHLAFTGVCFQYQRSDRLTE